MRPFLGAGGFTEVGAPAYPSDDNAFMFCSARCRSWLPIELWHRFGRLDSAWRSFSSSMSWVASSWFVPGWAATVIEYRPDFYNSAVGDQ